MNHHHGKRTIERSTVTGLWPLFSHAMPASTTKVQAWTDGSCGGKDRIGGWAYYVEHGTRSIESSGGAHDCTISMMELEALRQLLLRLKPKPHPLEIHSDSQYVTRTYTEWIVGWSRNRWHTATGKPVANVELVQEVWQLIREHRLVRPVSLIWVRGHVGNHGNERCDVLAGIARLQMKGEHLKLTAKPNTLIES